MRRGSYPKNSVSGLYRVLAWIWVSVWATLHYVSPLYVLSGLILPLIYGFTFATTTHLVIILLLMFYPHKAWPRARLVFKSWFEIFDLEYVVEFPEAEIIPNTKYIACWAPHGIIPIAGYMGFSWFEIVLKEHYGASAVASVLFYLPFIRQILLWCEAIPSDARSIKEAMKTRNLSIIPGGIAELFLSSREKEAVFMKHRTGIIRISLEQRAPILPIYMFGNTQFFDQAGFSLSRISRSLQMSLTFFYGRCYLPIPYPTKAVIVMGRPLALPPGNSQEDIKAVQEQWISEVQRLYNTYKHLANYPANKMLEIH